MSEVLLKSDNWPKNVYIILLGGCWREKWQTNTPKIAVTSGETCHTDRDKAAVTKSKLHPFHWQQREELVLRNVCLGTSYTKILSTAKNLELSSKILRKY